MFLFTFTSFGVVRVLGGAGRATIEVEVWRRATQLGDIGGAATLTVLQLAAARRGRGRRAAAPTPPGAPVDLRAGDAASPPRRAGGSAGSSPPARCVTALLVAAPLVALVERSLRFGDGYSLAAWRSLGDTEVRPGVNLGIDPLAALGRVAHDGRVGDAVRGR